MNSEILSEEIQLTLLEKFSKRRNGLVTVRMGSAGGIADYCSLMIRKLSLEIVNKHVLINT